MCFHQLVVSTFSICLMFKMYQEETLQEEKESISNAFASIEDGELLKEVLKFALSVSYSLF